MKLNSSIYNIFKVLLSMQLLILVILGTGCLKMDSEPALEIIVRDQFNNPVEQALVGIFADKEEWAMLENPLQAWKVTDKDGSVIFIGLLEKEYYIFAEKGELNNLKNEISSNQIMGKNKIIRIVIHIE